MSRHDVEMTVNGRSVSVSVQGRTHLADALRDELHLTGTHLGCEHGVCGACTLMIDGVPQRGCLTLAASCAGAAVTTIEGFDRDPLMAALRENFSIHHGLQCGYCTPGMLMTAYDLVRRLPEADDARIREELAGNLCRCTGYNGIVAAIQATLAAAPCEAIRQDTVEAEAAGPVAAARPDRDPATDSVADSVAVAGTDGAVELARSVPVALPLQDLWRVLSDIETVAACLPGVTLTSIEGEDRVYGHLIIAIGPIKARFDGSATVRYDPAAHRGRVTGRGQDKVGRSAAQGEISFAAAPVGDASRLDVALAYGVTGPFAQFSRGVLVAEVVARLLDNFSDNLVAAAGGGAAAPAPAAIRAEGLGLRILADQLRRWLGLVAGRPPGR